MIQFIHNDYLYLCTFAVHDIPDSKLVEQNFHSFNQKAIRKEIHDRLKDSYQYLSMVNHVYKADLERYKLGGSDQEIYKKGFKAISCSNLPCKRVKCPDLRNPQSGSITVTAVFFYQNKSNDTHENSMRQSQALESRSFYNVNPPPPC